MALDGRPHDIAIFGGGPAGAVLAQLLAGWGFGVVLIERSGVSSPTKYPEMLAPSARSALRTLSLEERLANDPALAVRCQGIRSFWGAAEEAVLDHTRLGDSGFIVERQRFDGWLADRAAVAGVARHVLPRSLPVPQRTASGWLIETGGGSCGAAPHALAARLLVDATGRAASLARRLGARRLIHDRLLAIGIAHDPGGDERQAAAGGRAEWLRVEAVEDGWWYALAGPDGRRWAVFVTDAPALGRAGAASAPAMARRLRETRSIGCWFGRKDGRSDVVGLPRMVDASSTCIDPISGSGWLSVGDAATSFDPVTSQGLPQALGAGLIAAHAIREHLAGQRQALAAYAEAARWTWLRSTVGRAAIYAGESRWRTAPFWLRRSAGGGARSAGG